jgi:hypothetical protein
MLLDAIAEQRGRPFALAYEVLAGSGPAPVVTAPRLQRISALTAHESVVAGPTFHEIPSDSAGDHIPALAGRQDIMIETIKDAVVSFARDQLKAGLTRPTRIHFRPAR